MLRYFLALQNDELGEKNNSFSLLPKSYNLLEKPKVNSTFNKPLQTACLILQKSSFNMFCHSSTDEKQLMENRKWCFSTVKLQGLFERCLIFDFSYFSDSFWKNMSDSKLSLQTLLFPTTKNFHWFRSRQGSRKKLDIFPETFTSIIQSSISHDIQLSRRKLSHNL